MKSRIHGAEISAFLSALLAPPDGELADGIATGEVGLRALEFCGLLGGDEEAVRRFPSGGTPRALLLELSREHARVFPDGNDGGVSLVESAHERWTGDPSCKVPFASQKGLLMGDCAVHMLDLCERCGLELDEGFRGRPDHLAVELEFLSFLYDQGEEEQIRRFMENHLRWAAGLCQAAAPLAPHPVYRAALGLLDLFLRTERSRLKVRDHEETSVS